MTRRRDPESFPTVPRSRLDEVLAQDLVADHLIEVIRAVRDDSLAYALVTPNCGSFDFPSGRPLLLIVGDDLETSCGPRAFDEASLAPVIGRSGGIAIVSCEPLVEVYDGAVNAALATGCAVLVETRPEQEIPWVWFVQKHKSQSAGLCMAGVREGMA